MIEKQKEFYVESYESYCGGVDEVIKEIENCPKCGEKFILTHVSDCTNLYVQETAKCLDCDYGARRVYHSLN